ncbi:hypothetical protein PHO31112_03529 [Pandoraea horticolens]|uniref:Phage-related membrane protein n=1 Tax=Pandoraea horticolens TaxID=2508298 RepID=A0A5E4WY74_9BURK|nr:hypothetical protein [Pandoraea horticolens]VVE28850.1 hypothetical protein PHO31112_03529 [Pandoraea horticolens]
MKETLQRVRTNSMRACIGITLATASCFAQAAGESAGAADLSALTSGISMGSTASAIIAAALTLVGVYATLRGAKIVLSLVKGG